MNQFTIIMILIGMVVVSTLAGIYSYLLYNWGKHEGKKTERTQTNNWINHVVIPQVIKVDTYRKNCNNVTDDWSASRLKYVVERLNKEKHYEVPETEASEYNVI